MANYLASDVATLSSVDVNAILTTAGLPITGNIAERRARIVDEEVEKPAPVATTLTKELFMGSTLGTSNGAEPIPMGLYSLVAGADGRPELNGGTYAVDGSIERSAYTPLDGVAADAQPDYIKKGAKRAVYFKAKHNQTNVEFRLSASALQAAIKGSAAAAFNPSGMELSQAVKENAGGYKIPTVTLA